MSVEAAAKPAVAQSSLVVPQANDTTPPNAFTVDVEDYYQVGVFQERLKHEEWTGFESRVERNLDVICEILERRGVKATFFVLGWLAERHPKAMRALADAGHEIGSHGYAHRPIWTMTPEEFRADLVRSLDAVGTATGRRPDLYRAPCFSIVPRTLWALDVLADAGVRFDSSIFPVNHPEYGIPGAERNVHRIRTPGGRTIWEFPMTTGRVMGKNVAFCGGGYFRLLPYWLVRKGLAKAEKTGHPFVFYMHPWEIDPDQPRLDDRAGRLGRFRHYVNLAKTRGRLEKLVADFRLGTMGDVFRWFEARGAREVTYS